MPTSIFYILFRLGNLEESRKYFEQSIERAKSDAEQEPQAENAICVTTNYNLGRIYEGLFLCDKAEKNYKDTLKGELKCIFCLCFINANVYLFRTSQLCRLLSKAWLYGTRSWTNLRSF